MPVPAHVRPNRDTVTTIRKDGSRLFLHPADARGFWTRARRVSAWLLIVVYLALPWIRVGAHPAVFLDIAGRRFHLFGLTLAFQDTWLLFFGITGLGFTLFFLTSLLGRVWCGWACPQTVFLEHVFRRVERLIEGDAVARRKLDAAPWSAGKLAKRVAKQAVFVVLSAIITHLFLAYFVSLPELWAMMRGAPAEHLGSFGFVAVATAILYFNFAWFREQLCLVICPYGRLQSVLIDDHSLVIGYDAKRGEPRGKAGREPGAGGREQGAQTVQAGAPLLASVGVSQAADPTRLAPRSPLLASPGACVDCNRCVQVCPTGIDIRQGLQIECIACAACVDACDEVMTKIKRPTGLVRYDSTAGFEGRRTRWLRPRVWMYLVFLAVGAAVATFAFSTVRPAVLGVTRLQGAPYFLDADAVRNQFLVRLVNKGDHEATFVVVVESADPAGAKLSAAGFEAPITLAPMAEEARPLVVRVPRADYAGGFKLVFRAREAGGAFELTREAEFSGPNAALLREDTR